MKPFGAIFLISLMCYNLSFSFSYNSFVEILNKKVEAPFQQNNIDGLFFDISNDSLLQPFMMDSEFSNINAHRGYIENDVNPIIGIRFINLLAINSVLLTDTVTFVKLNSILSASKFFIPSYSLVILLGNHFSFRT